MDCDKIKKAENRKRYYEANKERELARDKLRIRDPKKRSEEGKRYRENNHEMILSKQREFTEKNRDFINIRQRLYYKEKTKDRVKLPQPGCYNKTLAERNIEKWINTPAIVYLFKLIDEDNTIFYKYGITTDLKKRVHNIGYEVEIIKSIELDLYEAIYLEKKMLENVIKYIPKIKFGGYTECFVK